MRPQDHDGGEQCKNGLQGPPFKIAFHCFGLFFVYFGGEMAVFLGLITLGLARNRWVVC